MQLRYIILAILLLATPAIAQQQQIQIPAEVALQIQSVVGTWAQTLTQQGKLIDDLQKKNTALEAKIKELEEKAK